MKFYEKIIGINKDAPAGPELIITFSDNGFEFDHNLYLNGEDAIYFRNSQTAITDLDYLVLRFNGNGKSLEFDFSDQSGFSGGVIHAYNWNLADLYNPLNSIYSTNGYFNKLMPFGTSKFIGASTNYWDSIFVHDIQSTGITVDTIDVKDLTINPTDPLGHPLVLPENSQILVDGGGIGIAGVEMRDIDTGTSSDIKRSTSGSTWSATGKEVTWQGIATVVGQKMYTQFFAKIDLTEITPDHAYLLIPSPFADNSTLENDYLQLSYRGSGSSMYAPSIAPFLYSSTNYLLVERAHTLTCLYIQITRFTDTL